MDNDIYFKIILTPIFEIIDENNDKFLKVKPTDTIKNLFEKKFKKDKNKIFNTIYRIKFDSIDYDKSVNKIILIKTPTKKDYKILTYLGEDKKKSLIELYTYFFKDEIEAGPDTWQNSKIIKFSDYYLNLKIKQIKQHKNKKIKQRPSPSESATLFKVGIIKKGNDGNKWIVSKNINGIKKWKLIK
jgi:hypothetical protein